MSVVFSLQSLENATNCWQFNIFFLKSKYIFQPFFFEQVDGASSQIFSVSILHVWVEALQGHRLQLQLQLPLPLPLQLPLPLLLQLQLQFLRPHLQEPVQQLRQISSPASSPPFQLNEKHLQFMVTVRKLVCLSPRRLLSQ